MDKDELQYVIVARRWQVRSFCFKAFVIGTNKKHGFIAVAIGQKHKHIGFVASPLWLGRHL